MSTFDGLTHRVDSEIRKQRAADAEVIVVKADGSPLANQEVVIAQTSHRFLFGTAGFDIVLANNELSGDKKEQAIRRVDKLTAVFNAVTLPFYWARFEPQKGQPITGRLMKAAHWCVDH